MPTVRTVVRGVGSYLPDRVITNDALSRQMDTTDEWIFSRTGIRQRHFSDPTQTTSDLATRAAQQALDNAGIAAANIDLIIVATTTPDHTFPATAVHVQANLGAGGYAYDVSGACCGYLLALQSAHHAIQVGSAQTVLIVGAEKMSNILDMSDRSTCVLFGDGAGAVVLQSAPAGTEEGVIDIALASDGKLASILQTTGGPGSNNAASFIAMNGREVYRHAVRLLTASAQEMLRKHSLRAEDIDWFVPHQANLRIIQQVMDKLALPQEKLICTVTHHANTSAASIPLALAQASQEGRLKKGDLVLHEAIGAGLIWGSALLRW